MKNNFDQERQLFVQEPNPWVELCERQVEYQKDLKVVEVEDGLILPLRKTRRKEKKASDLEGGVCDSKGNFIAGHSRSFDNKGYKYTCKIGYTPNVSICERNETVIFGGVLLCHYGHLLVEGLSRMWWYADNKDKPYKIIFLIAPYNFFGKSTSYFQDVFDAAGIPREQYEFLEVPTRFKNIIVPEQSAFHDSFYYTGNEKFFDLIIENSKKEIPSMHKKIYFSRKNFGREDGINESYFENFYREKGFHICYPEEMTFLEKTVLLQGADEYVSLIQSGIFALFVAKEGMKVTLIPRDSVLSPNMISHCFPLQMRKLNYTIVQGDFDFLPTVHQGSNCFLYGPTPQWKEYLDTHEIPYEDEEVSTDIHLKPYVYDYIKKWGANYLHRGNYESIHNFDLITVLERINSLTTGTKIDRKDYKEPDYVTNLRNHIKKLDNDKSAQQQEIDTLKSQVKLLEGIVQKALDKK